MAALDLHPMKCMYTYTHINLPGFREVKNGLFKVHTGLVLELGL